MPTSRPIVTTYLSNEFYKAAFQWLAEKDDRSMAWLAARWIESQIDSAISEGQIPLEVVERLKEENKDD
ncbi:MAG: hypothetical protein F6K42_00550 [Leptolyngbya sp. SIO1D8]|nr:hypothetical protein [Leptolyngbya sp. SIO1D8]